MVLGKKNTGQKLFNILVENSRMSNHFTPPNEEYDGPLQWLIEDDSKGICVTAKSAQRVIKQWFDNGVSQYWFCKYFNVGEGTPLNYIENHKHIPKKIGVKLFDMVMKGLIIPDYYIFDRPQRVLKTVKGIEKPAQKERLIVANSKKYDLLTELLDNIEIEKNSLSRVSLKVQNKIDWEYQIYKLSLNDTKLRRGIRLFKRYRTVSLASLVSQLSIHDYVFYYISKRPVLAKEAVKIVEAILKHDINRFLKKQQRRG